MNVATFPVGTPCDLPSLGCLGCPECGYDCYLGEVRFVCSSCDAGTGDARSDAGDAMR